MLNYIEELNKLKSKKASADNPFYIMEVCGTHTMSIAECGLRQLLPSWVKLISGPGCPVCVTPSNYVDALLDITDNKDVVVCCYGDLIRIPGSNKGDSLKARKSLGADVRIVYSPMDALEIAKKETNKEVIFVGIGFETTAPGTAISIIEAKKQNVKNFSVLSLMKYTLQAVNKIVTDERCRLDGLICPGHVATIIGANAFKYLAKEYKIPCVVAGFKQDEIIRGVYDLCKLLCDETPMVINDYKTCVEDEGNTVAMEYMGEVFEKEDAVWRGLGLIKDSGMKIKESYKEYDASVKFNYQPAEKENNNGCCCGQVLMGIIPPEKCPKYGKECNPVDPLGPCMVSSEGACAASYKYRGIIL